MPSSVLRLVEEREEAIRLGCREDVLASAVPLFFRPGGGEYPAQDGFGWTNGVALALEAATQRLAIDSMPHAYFPGLKLLVAGLPEHEGELARRSS